MSSEGKYEESKEIETIIDLLEESFDLVTPRNRDPSQETPGAKAGDARTQRSPEEEDLGERLRRICQGLGSTGTQEDPTQGARRELTFKDRHQDRSQSDDSRSLSQDGQALNQEEEGIMSNSTTVTGVPTVSSDAAAMFKTADPQDADLYAQGGCQYPRSS